jgi:hypothetical protein
LFVVIVIMSFYTIFRNILFALSRITYPLALCLIVICFIFGWTGFSVPDWLALATVSEFQRKFGLWNTCIQSITFFSNGFDCQSWANSQESKPDFLETTSVFITFGCIFISFATGTALLGAVLKRSIFRFLPLVAAFFSAVAFVFIAIGLSVFGGDYEAYGSNVSGTSVHRRWGYWIFVPVALFLLWATFLFPYHFIYKYYISNRLYNNFRGLNKGITIPVPAPPIPMPIDESFVPHEEFIDDGVEAGFNESFGAGPLEFAPRGDRARSSVKESKQSSNETNTTTTTNVNSSNNTDNSSISEEMRQQELTNQMGVFKNLRQIFAQTPVKEDLSETNSSSRREETNTFSQVRYGMSYNISRKTTENINNNSNNEKPHRGGDQRGRIPPVWQAEPESAENCVTVNLEEATWRWTKS